MKNRFSVESKYSFSVMKRLKNWTRNTMTNDRFTNLSISIEIYHSIESENVLNIFTEKQTSMFDLIITF